MQVYELITCVRRANENAGNLISGVQFLINIYIYMMLINESHVFELHIETKFEGYDPCTFFYATYVVMNPVQA